MSEQVSIGARVAEVLSQHRQEHIPDTGAATCACHRWTGPFTMHTGAGSYAEHLAKVLIAAGLFAANPAPEETA